MKSTCIIVALVAFVAFVKADTATQSTFDKTIADALSKIEAGVKKFEEVTGIKTEFDRQKVEKFLNSGFGDSKKKIEDILKNLETSGKPLSEEFKKSVETLSAQFSQTVKSLNTTDVNKLREEFQTSFTKLVEKSKDVMKANGVATPSPEIQKSVEDFIKEVSKGAEAVKNKLEQLINEAQKKKTE